ncbi:ROK family protein [Mycoplasma crocodyli]|uniref:ROK family hexose kinase n=1 Tax=Mycoplasma crocodyli (strain ATCC 51981 / MP145) TaxID=512564 RepID=D5E507_MYCCM|nr:ROK family protein [Mycoplasma crocodyli]ADE19777.1 ROK family hexose kinase [Mycoplasma crocodyli MP145]
MINNNKIAAVDIGGTNTRFALFDQNGKIKLKEKTSSSFDDSHLTCNWILELVNKYNIEHLALCIPGPSDYEKGLIINPPNLRGSWLNFDMKSYLLKNSKLKTIIFENDANAMALSNHREYKIDKNKVSQFYTISTGFGSGLIINDSIYHGKNYLAQEVAQIPVCSKSFELTHHMRNNYALELHCSGKGLEVKAKALKIANSTQEVFELAKSGNKDAIELLNTAVDTLARMIAINAGMLAPHNYFIGGSVALNNKWFIDQAVEKAKIMSDPIHLNGVNFYYDKNGDDSALYGLYHLIQK